MKYKVGDVILWIGSTQVYEVTEVHTCSYKIKLIQSANEYDKSSIGVYEGWYEKSHIESGSRKLTKLDRALS